MQFASETLSCSLTDCNFLISKMRDLDKTYNKNQFSTKSYVDTQPVKHKIINVPIKQTVIDQEKLPYAPHFPATSEVPYLTGIRSLI